MGARLLICQSGDILAIRQRRHLGVLFTTSHCKISEQFGAISLGETLGVKLFSRARHLESVASAVE